MEKVDYLPLYNGEEKSETSRRSCWWKTGLKALVSLFVLVQLYQYSRFATVRFQLTGEETSPKDILLKELQTNLAGEWSKKYTSEPHLAGTNYGLVEFTVEKFKQYGFKPTVDTYDVLLSYPKDHSLHLLKNGTSVYEAPLKEDVLDEDVTTQGDDTVPTFLGYAANGNVTGQYVYANYATKQDFDQLKKLKIDVKGKIVIAKYGAIFRGLKLKFAQEAGAIGVLLYSDPGDDFGITPANGYKQYPHGPARHESSVQRGSCQFLGGLGATPGDPTTPGYASKPGVDRADPHQSIGKIPALPISYREVLPILEKLNGHGEQIKHWKGELEGFEYFTGPNPKYKLNLYNDQDFNITTIYNVYGEIKGEKSDETIIIGNHRDAWIKGGAGDPNSGSAVLLEVARALGALQKRGYKFKRNIILQSFDGEEYGLLGSTEAGEYFSKKYKRNVVAYFNLDSAVSGKNLHLAASPILNKLLLEVAGEIDYPEEKSLVHHFEYTSGNISTLGSGSDFTVFLEHLGIPSVDLGFRGGKGDAVYQYHSNYDSYHWMEKFGDKDFTYHNIMAKYLTLLIYEFSERELINFGVEDYSKQLLNYYHDTLPSIPKEWLNKKVSREQLNQFNSDYENSKFIRESTSKVYGSKGCHYKPYPEFVETFGCPMSYKTSKQNMKREENKENEHSKMDKEEHLRFKQGFEHKVPGKSQKDVPGEDHPHKDHPHKDHPHKDHPEKDHPHKDHPDKDHPNKDHPHKDHPHKDPPHKDHPHKDHPHKDHPHKDHPHKDHPHKDHPHKGHPDNDHPHHNPHHNATTTVQDILDLFKTDLEDFTKVAEVFDEKTSLLQQKYEIRDLLHWWQRLVLNIHIKHQNKLLKYFERNFLYYEGLKERSWFKHIIFASGRYTGYAGQEFPGLNEAIEDKDFEDFIKWLCILGKTIRRIKRELR